MSNSLGSLAIVANTPATFQVPNSGVKGILIGNESGLTVTITMESGGVQKTLYPSMLDWYAVKPGFTGNVKIAPTIILNNVSSFPASSLVFDAIGLNDPEDASMYPVHMPRNTNIGNTINTVGGSANSIINDNNAPGTSIIEATNSADGASAVTLNNSGILVLGNATHHGSFSTDNTNISSDGSGNLTVKGTSGIIVSGGKIGKTSAGDLIDAVSVATELHITTSGGDIVFFSPAGTEVGRLTNAGMLENKGAINAEGIVSGSTSGTAVLYQIFGHAHYKLVIVEVTIWNSTLKTFSIGTAFTTRAQVRALDNAPPMRFLNSGVAVGMDLVTGFSAGGVRSFTSVTSIAAGGFMGAIKGAFDTVELSATGTVGPATIIIEGY